MSDRAYSIVNGRRIAASVCLVLCVGYGYYAWTELSFGRWRAPGAAIFPLGVAVMVAIASIAVLLERKESSAEHLGQTFRLPTGADLGRLVGVLVAFAVYFVAMDYIGHMIASALFLFVAMAILSDKPRLRLAIHAAIIAVSFELFFVRFLQVQMPYGLTRLF